VTRHACVIGSGAREHAIAQVLARSADVVVTPGNDAMAGGAVSVTATSPIDLTADLFFIGPDQLVVDGLADELRAQGKRVVGPGADGARLEGSKSFMKELLATAGVPTARHGVFDDEDSARAFMAELGGTVVVKTDGLAAGKGVLVTDDLDAALDDVRAKLSGSAFGSAGRRVVIEEGLVGEECSIFVLVDGTNAVALEPARDYKRLFDRDAGPNTGGMGAVSPAPRVDDVLVKRFMVEAVEPTLAELDRRGIVYRGVLYAGLMVTPTGPKVLEYNVRFGDPEAQVVLPRLASDAFDLFESVASGTLTSAPEFVDDASVCVVLASEGYPDSPALGAPIDGLAADGQLRDWREGVTIFHAGTRRRGDQFETAGGRVVSVTALGRTIEQARERAYDAADCIQFPGRQLRGDIAAPPSAEAR
jgi:phosphoribosylamine---glycine ligase